MLDDDLLIRPAQLNNRQYVYLVGGIEALSKGKLYGYVEGRGDIFYFAVNFNKDTMLFNENRAREGGSVRVFGDFVGTESYKTRSGKSRVMPIIDAGFIDFMP